MAIFRLRSIGLEHVPITFDMWLIFMILYM